jgi:hypothetical protein
MGAKWRGEYADTRTTRERKYYLVRSIVMQTSRCRFRILKILKISVLRKSITLYYVNLELL